MKLAAPGNCGPAFFGKGHKKLGQAGGVVASYMVLCEQVGQDRADSEPLNLLEIIQYRFSVLSCVSFARLIGNPRAVQDDSVEEVAASIVKCAEMVGRSVAPVFAGLGHQVTNIGKEGFVPANLLRYAANE